MTPLRAVKGMHDLLPADIHRWQDLESRFRATVQRYGFGEIRTPIVEPTQLFVRSIGASTDIVEKEMYSFHDKADKSLTLRPEGTASCVRAFLEHRMSGQQPTQRWYYLGPMYRRERPAKGRYRQFFQAGVEVFGDPGPYVDAEIVEMLVGFLEQVGVPNVSVAINSLGSGTTRERYRHALLEYLTPHREALSADSQRRLESNALRVLDSKAPQDQDIVREAPRISEYLEPDDAEHFRQFSECLVALDIPFVVEPRLVRGLDYYSRTLFEVRSDSDGLGAQNAICGGGRYDGLVETLGGPSTPAIGFALGIERVLMASRSAVAPQTADAFIISAQPELRTEALLVATELRNAGLHALADLRGTSVKSQMRRADKSGAGFAVILGTDERDRGVVQVKQLEDQGQQHEVPRHALATHLASKARM